MPPRRAMGTTTRPLTLTLTLALTLALTPTLTLTLTLTPTQDRVELEQQKENALLLRIFGIGALLMLPPLLYHFFLR